MAVFLGRPRVDSGVRAIDLAAVVVERRRQIVTDGVNLGRWTHEFALCAIELATRPGLPVLEQQWCELLDDLQDAMGQAVLRACGAPFEESTAG